MNLVHLRVGAEVVEHYDSAVAPPVFSGYILSLEIFYENYFVSTGHWLGPD